MAIKCKHRWIVYVLLLSLCLPVIAGCARNTALGGASATSSPAAGSSAGQTELLVSAAASLKDVLNELVPKFHAAHPGIAVRLNLASSGSLQQQIEQGAPADVFISAGAKQMNALADKQLTNPDLTGTLLTNDLVLVVPADSAAADVKAEDLTGLGFAKIAVGQPESVPAGMYAQQFLQQAGLWDTLLPKIVFAKDVRQVLTYVASGNVEAGLVYGSDAAGEPKVKVAMKVDPSTHDPISYPAAVLAESAHPEQAKVFYDYLFTKEAGDVFLKYGFKLAGK
ncbi:molybdate ABC transporter substrate-binding protein [Paenibacillus sp. 7124]|uniref:Molybdate ABC transporter substrate-binding protein n=1 Tax=Paenibacillus apii TaxID=1850370 RepID=A0A6M1PQ86_9BACL|nr:molybdate ABC transporter substrate-binding protein [Paenibacillus apii]NGM82461.1 molybdate ABC transporter substrate-binding protein [Paenibacillus apii]